MGNREAFEKWAHMEGLSLAAGSGRYYAFDATHNTYVGYSARQPEIDAKDKVIDDLALQKGILKDKIGRLESENEALKAEVERLRKDLGARQKLDDRFKGRKTRIDGADIGIPCFDESAMKEPK